MVIAAGRGRRFETSFVLHLSRGSPARWITRTKLGLVFRSSPLGWTILHDLVVAIGTDSSCPGCFTCRLRRKKCDEGKPLCKACKHLGLSCEYKRPMWWSNNESRRREKERIKNIIKRTKLSEKTAQAVPLANSPPSLCHSLPTSDTSASEGLGHTRAVSEDSQFDFNDFNSMPAIHQDFSQMLPPQCFPPFTPLPDFSPYEVDIKTERQTFVNDVPMRKDSTISSFSTYQAPQSHSIPDNWIQQDYFESRRESLVEDPLDFAFFDFPHGPLSPSHNAPIEVEECDQHLLDHFLNNVMRLIFPILEVNQHGSAGSDVVIPALKANKTYLHCCLSIAALHLKATERLQGEQVDNDIMRHRFTAISELCEALKLDVNHKQILEATLGMIFFQCCVGRPNDCLPDIPWHQHFQAASSLIHRLELPQHLVELNTTHGQPPFNMTLAAWIDILGSTMTGRPPVFGDMYREKNIANATAGLAELMGCEDRVMFMISEIACLEALKLEGTMDDVQLCTHISYLGEQITMTEQVSGPLVSPYSQTGHIMPKQLQRNITAVFRIATRIYLCSLVPDFDRYAQSITFLVDQFIDAMQYIPPGPDGFDRSLVWPLLVAGAVSIPGSSFRSTLEDRCAKLGEAAQFGSFGRAREILKDVWQHNDEAAARGEKQSVHWRDVMRQKGWDFLLI
jgi:C6 transcription factor Pro1